MKFIFFAILLFVSSLNATNQFGFLVPSSFKEIANHRFQSTKSYEDTKKDFAKIFQSSKLKIDKEINLPHVRAISYKNYEKNSNLLAVNIYLNMQNGLTEIFFLSK